MKATCRCGKVLDADECAFHNDHYEDLLVFVCPYCGVLSRALIPLSLDDLPSMTQIMREEAPVDEERKKRMKDRFDQIQETMMQNNDAALAGANWIKQALEKEP